MKTTPASWTVALCFVSSLFLPSASANLSESSGEIAARYGSGTVVTPTKPAEQAQGYTFQDMKVLVQFWKERSCSEQYCKARPLSEEEMANLLKANVDKSFWQRASADVWVRVDKAAIAYLGDKGRVLVVEDYAFHAEVKKNPAQTMEVKPSTAPANKILFASVTKVTICYMGDAIMPNSFAAKPKTFYMAGDTYLRVEEELDPAEHLQGLIICNEPDIWMINLANNQGKHLVDPGPTFVTHNTILPPGTAGEVGSLEMGKEINFFERHHAVCLEAVLIEGQRCKTSEYKEGSYRLVLNVKEGTSQPCQLDVFEEGKPKISIRYLSYEQGLPFDVELFKPPTSVTIAEQQTEKR